MNAVAPNQFAAVTEQPGQSASQLQLAMMAARYAWARSYAPGCDVLEVACGSGAGLGALSEVARTLEAGDIDKHNLAAAQATYRGEPNIRLQTFDALDLPYPDFSFDLVLLLEALYYVPNPNRFFDEACRVLRPGGHLLIATVNRKWSGFNPSPYSTRYHSADELRVGLRDSGLSVELKVGFPEQRGICSSMISLIRRSAVAAGLVPRTMNGKALLKRIFYGRLEPVPARLELDRFPPAKLDPLRSDTDLSRYRVLYAAARKGYAR